MTETAAETNSSPGFFRRALGPLARPLAVAFSGLLYFVISLPLMMPLRMKPVENYNLFLMPLFTIVFFFLIYQTCTVVKQSKAYTYAFFAGILAWQLFGELSSLPVPEGLITQFSSVNIKVVGGYFFLAGGWILLKVLWRTQAIKNPVAVFVMTFLSIWTFELYMDNYSVRVPIDMMPMVSNVLLAVFTVITIFLLVIAWRADSPEKKTVMGCLLYLTFSIMLLSSGQWRKPQTFYVKYEGSHIDHELHHLKMEKEKIEKVKDWMLKEGMITEEELRTTGHDHSTDDKDHPHGGDDHAH